MKPSVAKKTAENIEICNIPAIIWLTNFIQFKFAMFAVVVENGHEEDKQDNYFFTTCVIDLSKIDNNGNKKFPKLR